jgi:hypothetical protein
MRRFLRTLFGTQTTTITRRTESARQRRARLNVESLEARANPSSFVQNGVLCIVGTDNADTVTVHYQPASYSPYGFYLPAGFEVRENGVATVHRDYSLYTGGPGISRIEFDGKGGNDYFNDHSNRVPVAAFGGAGHDTLMGYNHADYLDGGGDNDRLYGYGGQDYLGGGSGDDLLRGDAGNDTLHGSTGRDTLTGGADLDSFDGGADFDLYRDDFNLAQPFYNGQAVEDIIQQDGLTCQTLAALASATRAGHSFAGQITYLGNNQYQVRVFPGGTGTNLTVTFDGAWSDNDPAPARDAWGRTLPEFWTILLQRARLQGYGVNWQTELTAAQWQAQLNAGNFRFSDDAMRTLTGRSATRTLSLPSATTIQSDLANGRMVQVATRSTLPAGAPVRQNHVYAVTGIWQDGTGQWHVFLYDPYGAYRVLTWGQFTANFVEYAVA